MSREEYFAVRSSLEDLIDKIEQFGNRMISLGQAQRIARSYAQYYGQGYDSKSDQLIASGDQGEETRISVNKFRTLLRHQLSMITSERPATHVTPINTDYKSIVSAEVGNQVLDYYMKAKDLENVILDAMESAVWSSEGYVALTWATEDGDFFGVDPDTNKPVMSGDIRYTTYSSDRVIRDIYQANPQWYILADTANKWDLIAKMPEKEQKIKDSGLAHNRKGPNSQYQHEDIGDDDRVTLYTFYHKKTPALPEGRLVVFTDSAKLLDMPLPYENVPVYRVAAANVHNTNLGYTQAFDLLAIQEASDELYSAVVSNNINFSRQCIVIPRNADINYRDITEGFSVIEAEREDAAGIQALQLTNSAGETYNLLDKLDDEMKAITGVNEVVQGNPGPNVRAANAMALLSAQAIKYNSTLQQSYVKLLEDVGTATLRFLQEFAVAPRFMEVVDKSERSYLKEFTKDDLMGVSRVQVEKVSALSKTQAGRVEMANNLLQNGLIKRPEQYLMVLSTGKLEPLVQAEQSELLNIKAENENLAAGTLPIAIITDDHSLHIREHRTVLDNPDARHDPEVTETTLAHIQEHLALWQSADMNILAATRQEPIQMPMAPEGPMGGSSPESLPPEGAVPPEENIGGPQDMTMPEETPVEDMGIIEQENPDLMGG